MNKKLKRTSACFAMSWVITIVLLFCFSKLEAQTKPNRLNRKEPYRLDTFESIQKHLDSLNHKRNPKCGFYYGMPFVDMSAKEFPDRDTTILFIIKNKSAQKDTLFLSRKKYSLYSHEFNLIYKQDSIANSIYFGDPNYFFTYMDTINCINLFVYKSDGEFNVRSQFRVLHFDGDNNYVLSDNFGDNHIDDIEYNLPDITFYFNFNRETSTQRTKYTFNVQTNKLTYATY